MTRIGIDAADLDSFDPGYRRSDPAKCQIILTLPSTGV